MCLPLNPYKIEREWKHAGLNCAVVQNQEAMNRCGYVRVPPGHPAYMKKYEEVDISVHGGLTFAQLEECNDHPDGQGWWLGFDCVHWNDCPYDRNVDIETVSSETRQLIKFYRQYAHHEQEHYWTEAEVVAETERLAEQLAYDGQNEDAGRV